MRNPLKAPRIRGFTMVEMLVALVVLSVGMLGVAGLFVISLRSGGSAVSRMQAVNLASDMADRIRSNRRAGDTYAGVGADQNCAGVGARDCTAAQMAQTDLFLWREQIEAVFPGRGEGIVDYADPTSATGPAVYTITIRWREQAQSDEDGDDDEDATVQSYSTRVEAPLN